MKNKKSLYILIPVVILVWGIIIYRVIKMTQTDPVFATNITSEELASDTILYPELIKLKLNYSDPFLRAVIPDKAGEESSSEFSSLFKKNPEPEIVKVVWPEIVYKGKVENGSKMLGIIQQGKKRLLVSENEEFGGLRVKEIYKDSIVLIKDKEKKAFYK